MKKTNKDKVIKFVNKINKKVKEIDYIKDIKVTKVLSENSFQVLAKVELTIVPEPMQDLLNLKGGKVLEQIYRTIGKTVLDKIKNDGK
jgi:hypothetical protein